jgi:antitoxin ParD1/3/4
MRSTQQFSITLPNEMARAVEKKVESGAYASVSEVVREGIRSLLDRDVPFERWLREDVVRSYEEYKADPASAIPVEKAKERIRDLAERRRK